MHWVIIPFRGPGSAKSRLAEGLSDTARRQVARAMFQHVLNVSCRAAGPKRVLVVTPSVRASRIAKRVGACVLRQDGTGHNEAVAQACAYLRRHGALTATIVAADLPLLATSDVALLMRRARDGSVAIAPDRAGAGTNALALPLSLPFVFHFGDGSFNRHQQQVRERYVPLRSVRQPGLASDVDVVGDLELLEDPEALSTLPTVGAASYRGLR